MAFEFKCIGKINVDKLLMDFDNVNNIKLQPY